METTVKRPLTGVAYLFALDDENALASCSADLASCDLVFEFRAGRSRNFFDRNISSILRDHVESKNIILGSESAVNRP